MERKLLTKLSNLPLRSRPLDLYPQARPFLSQPQRRTQATYQRTKARLRIKPDPTFLPSPSEPQDHIIYNPPPSAPSIYQTPSLFLPPDDPRRQLSSPQSTFNSSPSSSSTTTTSPSSSQLSAPLVRQPYQKKYHLKEIDLEEMRELRKSDPLRWSASKLAKKFDCSPLFVSLATDGMVGKEKRKQQKRVLDVVKSRWGVKRRRAREDRALRRERWGRYD